MTSLFNIVKSIEDDIKTKTTLPVVTESSIPNDSASMRMALNNPDEFYRYLDSNVKRMTGEINIQLSHKLGSTKYTMLALAAKVTDIYKRIYTFTVGGYTVNIEQVRTTSIYQSESNEHINVIISFVCYID